MIRAYLKLMADNADLASVLLFEHRSLDPKQHARHIPNRDRFEALWRDVVLDGVKSKKFHVSNPALAVRAMLANYVINEKTFSKIGPAINAGTSTGTGAASIAAAFGSTGVAVSVGVGVTVGVP